MHGHGAAVEVDVVAALAVGEDLDALNEAGGVGRGRGQRVGAVRVPDATREVVGRRSSASWGSTARHAAPSRSWCCSSSACSPGSASAHPGLRR